MARTKKTTGLKADLIASATGKGKEPVWGGKFAPPTQTELSRALSHYNSDLYKTDQYKAWAIEYLRTAHPHLVERAMMQPAWYFSTFGKLARCVARGMQTDSYIIGKLTAYANAIPEIAVKSDDDEETDSKKARKPRKSRENAIYRAFDDALDSVLAGNDANAQFEIDALHDPAPVIAYCEEQLAAIKDEPGIYPKHMKAWFKNVIERLSKVKKVAKVRKPRVRKVNPIKMAAKVKYLKTDAALKIDSLNPTEIVGAKKVYLYDTKYKRITKLISGTAAGFTIKGTTVQGFDVEKSSVTFFKKPEIELPKTRGIRELDRAMTMTKSKRNPEATGRINENTLILAVS